MKTILLTYGSTRISCLSLDQVEAGNKETDAQTELEQRFRLEKELEVERLKVELDRTT